MVDFDPGLLIVFHCNIWNTCYRWRDLRHFSYGVNDEIAISVAEGGPEVNKRADSDSLTATY
jgi:hypothetical protein